MTMNRSASHDGPPQAASHDQHSSSDTVSRQDDDLRRRIVETVHGVEPDARIVLFGSRARGDARSDADWDLLILLDGAVDSTRDEAISRRLYELELFADEILCPVILSRQDWDSPRWRAMPFRHNVEREGVVLSAGRRRAPRAGAVAAAESMAADVAGDASAPNALGSEAFHQLCRRIKETVHSVVPDSEVILYGSQACGEARPDAGWDLLILLDRVVDKEREARICRRLYEIEWSTGEVLCPLVFSRQDWSSPRFRATPLYHDVDRDGVVL